MKHDFSKGTSLALIAGMYVFALCIGVRAFAWAVDVMPELWALLVADVAMTVLIWGFGLVYENVSIYDPYWSVIPPAMFTAWALYKHCFTLPVILLLIAVWWWGIRLTGNWVWTFKGIGHEDWRYTRYRDTLSPFLFQITNFFGLNMVPTLVVFACMLPGFAPAGGRHPDPPLPGRASRCSMRRRPVEARPPSELFRRNNDVVGRLADVRLPAGRRLADACALRDDRPLPLHQHSDDGTPAVGAQAGVRLLSEAYAAVHLVGTTA